MQMDPCLSAGVLAVLTLQSRTGLSLRLGVALHKAACFTRIQGLLRIHMTEQLDQLGDDSGPSCLVTGAETSTIITVEVLIEENVVLPQRVSLEFLRASEHRSPA